MRKIIQKIDFFALEVVKTTSWWIFWRKSKNQKSRFFENFFQDFSKIHVTSAWKNFFFSFLENIMSQISYALWFIKKYLKLATVCSKEVAWQKQLILPTFRANQIFLTDKKRPQSYFFSVFFTPQKL